MASKVAFRKRLTLHAADAAQNSGAADARPLAEQEQTLDPKLAGADQVISIFGYWPSFHDAEVVRLELLRTEPFELGPALLADIHTFEMTDEIGSDGCDVVDIRARQMENLAYEVHFDSSFGVHGGFMCRDVRIERVRPWTSDQRNRPG